MNEVIVWMLVLVTPDAMVERQAFDTRHHCMAVGTGYAERSIWERQEEIEVDGFFCEPQPQEARVEELPKCLAPVDQCS